MPPMVRQAQNTAMSALAVEVLFSDPCAYCTESETLEKSKGYRHSREGGNPPLDSHFPPLFPLGF